MERSSDGLVVKTLYGKSYNLGWIYNSASMECSPPKAPQECRYENTTSWDISIYSKYDENFFAYCFKDDQSQSAQETIRVQIRKMNTKTACERIDNPSSQRVVTSLINKQYVDLLLLYGNYLPKCFKDDLKAVFKGMIDEEQVSFPTSICDGITGVKLHNCVNAKQSTNITWSLKEAYRQLKDTIMEKPTEVFISDGNLERNSLSKVMCTDTDNWYQLYSKTCIEIINRYRTCAHVALNAAMINAVEKNNSISSNGSLKDSKPAEIHLTKSLQAITKEDDSQLKGKEDQSKEIKCQSKISPEEIFDISQTTQVNGSRDNTERLPVTMSQPTQSSNTKDSQYATNDNMPDQMDNSWSSKGENSTDISDNQELTTRSNSPGKNIENEISSEKGRQNSFHKPQDDIRSQTTPLSNSNGVQGGTENRKPEYIKEGRSSSHRIKLSLEQTSSQQTCNKSKNVQRDRSNSLRRKNSHDGRGNQACSMGVRSSSHGRIVSQEKNNSQQRSDDSNYAQSDRSNSRNSRKREKSHEGRENQAFSTRGRSSSQRRKVSNVENSSQQASEDRNLTQRNRSNSPRKLNSHDGRENQELSTRGRSSSRGRKVSQEQTGNKSTLKHSSSQSSGGNNDMPLIRSNLCPRSSNTNSSLSINEIEKNIDESVLLDEKKSKEFVAQPNPVNQSCPDQNVLTTNLHEFTENKAESCDETKKSVKETCDETNKSDTDINDDKSISAPNIASNSLDVSGKDSVSFCINENKLEDTQTSLGCISSPGYSRTSHHNTHSNLKLLTPSKVETDPCGMKRYYYGNSSSIIEEKVILLLGASGSGKTTLVNFFANFFEEVKKPDDEKVIISQPLEKTKEITAYTFCFDNGTVITLIDTPGLNDSSGSEIRDHVNSLKTFLANTASYELQIHALGFVAQAHLVRLTSSERLVMDYVSTLFGEGVNENIISLISFADVQDRPPVVEAMKNYGIKIKNFLKFNTAVLKDSSVEVDEIDRAYWRTGYKNWKKGIKLLKELMPLSINAMKTLQKEVFTKSVVEKCVNDLNDELYKLISIYDKGNLKEIRSLIHQIWDLGTIIHYHLRHTQEVFDSLEILLVTSVVKICSQSQSHNPLDYLKILSFYSPKGLEECTKAIISSIHPVYNSAKYMQIEKRKINEFERKSKKYIVYSFQDSLFCRECKGDHIMERIDDSRVGDSIKRALGYNQPENITFRCIQCKCDGNMHSFNPRIKSGGISNTFGSDVDMILHHTNNLLLNVAKKYALPNSNMTVKELLNFLMKEEDPEINKFLNDLLRIL